MATYCNPLLILSSRKLLCFSENMAGIAQKSVYMKQREKKKKTTKCPKYLRQGAQLGSSGGRNCPLQLPGQAPLGSTHTRIS